MKKEYDDFASNARGEDIERSVMFLIEVFASCNVVAFIIDGNMILSRFEHIKNQAMKFVQ